MLLRPGGDIFQCRLVGEVEGNEELDSQNISEYWWTVYCNYRSVIVSYPLVLIVSIVGYVEAFPVLGC